MAFCPRGKSGIQPLQSALEFCILEQKEVWVQWKHFLPSSEVRCLHGLLGRVLQRCQAGVSPSFPGQMCAHSLGNEYPSPEAAWTLGQDPAQLGKGNRGYHLNVFFLENPGKIIMATKRVCLKYFKFHCRNFVSPFLCKFSWVRLFSSRELIKK